MDEELIYSSMVIRSQAEAIESLEKENKKYKEVIDKVKFAIKTNCIKNGKKYEEICCDGDYLLQILEDKEVKTC